MPHPGPISVQGTAGGHPRERDGRRGLTAVLVLGVEIVLVWQDTHPLNTPPINNTQHTPTHTHTNTQQRCNANTTSRCNAYARQALQLLYPQLWHGGVHGRPIPQKFWQLARARSEAIATKKRAIANGVDILYRILIFLGAVGMWAWVGRGGQEAGRPGGGAVRGWVAPGAGGAEFCGVFGVKPGYAPTGLQFSPRGGGVSAGDFPGKWRRRQPPVCNHPRRIGAGALHAPLPSTGPRISLS